VSGTATATLPPDIAMMKSSVRSLRNKILMLRFMISYLLCFYIPQISTVAIPDAAEITAGEDCGDRMMNQFIILPEKIGHYCLC